MGRCSGLHPAMAALIATFSTVAAPSPGARCPSTSNGSRLTDFRKASTNLGVGAMSGKPSPSSRSKKSALNFSQPSWRSAPLNRSSAAATTVPFLVRARGGGSVTRIRANSSNTPSRSVAASSRLRLVMVYGITTKGSWENPNTRAEALKSDSKPRAVTATVGRPACSISIMSCTRYDVQEPQSAVAPTTTSQDSLMSFMRSAEIGLRP